ncbi:hypothetical protein HDU98_009457 [Podochytrium sp. JEL0797]|nr:hypothetical protein HDU98_009457 [Podochytrium sp. JEL0797]
MLDSLPSGAYTETGQQQYVPPPQLYDPRQDSEPSSAGGFPNTEGESCIPIKETVSEADLLDIDQKPQPRWKRCLCCCCPRKKSHKIVCGVSVVAVLIALALVGYFYFPRFPATEVYSIDLTNLAGSNSPFRFSYLHDDHNLNDVLIQMNLTMNVGTANPNRYGLYVNEIDMVARIMVNISQVYNPMLNKPLTSFTELVEIVGPSPIPPPGYYGSNDSVIGTATTTEGIFFPANTLVNYTLIFEMRYTPDPLLGILKDPTVMEIADACGITSRTTPPGRPIKIDYVATSTIASLEALNYAPKIKDSLHIICPFSQQQIDSVIQYVQDGLSVEEAIKINRSPSYLTETPQVDEGNQEQPLLSHKQESRDHLIFDHKAYGNDHPGANQGFLHSIGEYPVAGAPMLDVLDKSSGADRMDKGPKPPRKWERYVFCCVKKRSSRIFCCVSVWAVLITLAALAAVYFPRFPETHVYSIDLTNLIGSSSAFQFSYLNNSNNLNDLVIRMNLTMDVGTRNPNRYGLYINEIDLVARVAVNTSYVYNPLLTKPLTSYGALVQLVGATPVPPPGYHGANDSIIGTAQTTSGIFFPSQTWVNYTLNFELFYTPDPKLGLLNDPTILELADVCGITSRYSPPGRPMRIDYDATSIITALQALNYAPSLKNYLYIICPFTQAQIDDTIRYVQEGVSVTEALKIVFEGAPPPSSVNGTTSA